MRKAGVIVTAAGLWLAGSLQTAAAEMESWYTYWSIGGANHSYEEPLESAVNAADDFPGVGRTETSIDMFGFYWPLANERTAAGFVISGSADRLEDSFGHIQLNQYLYGGSVMHFFGDEVGDGLFLRGDLGFSKLVADSSWGDPVDSDTGSGILLGVGYGIPVTEGFRLLLSLTASNNNVEGHDYKTTAFKIGGMW